MKSKETPEYWVTWYEDPDRTRAVTPEGPFKSVRAAEKYIREDAEDMYIMRACGRDDTWGDDHLILQVVKRVRPVPIVSVRVELKTVRAKGGENA